MTTPVHTAWDLARRSEPTLIRPSSITSGLVESTLIEAVVAVDALARVGRFPPDLLLHFLNHYPRARGADLVPEVLALADPLSGSPMETRLRLLLIGAGLPRPKLQWVVQDPAAREAVWLDLAYPEHRVGVEYDGEEHTRPERVRRDIRRGTRLVDQGWRLYRYTSMEIYSEAERIVSEVGRALARAA